MDILLIFLLIGVAILVAFPVARILWRSGKEARTLPKSRNRTGWRALQQAGVARARARNLEDLKAVEHPEKLGRAHRKRLQRRSSGGPWR